jgi:hypothetical protein
MLRVSLVTIALIACMTGASGAEDVRRTVAFPVMKSDVRVTVNMNFFVPASMSDKNAAVKAQEDARRIFYESASRECQVLLTAIASECRLESINVGMNRNYSQHQPDSFNANGNFSYRVTIK